MEELVGERQVVPDQAKAIARALASADNAEGQAADWQMWLPFGLAIYEAFPSDYVIVSKREYRQLTQAAASADPKRAEIMEAIRHSARQLLMDFLDPTARAIAMGRLGEAIQTLARYDWRHEERNGR